MSEPIKIVVTIGGSPADDVNVQILTEDGRYIVWSGKTDSAGELSATVDPANYRVYLERDLDAFTGNLHDITVVNNGGGGALQTFALTGTSLGVAAPAAPAECRVWGYIQSAVNATWHQYAVYVRAYGSGYNSYVAGAGAHSDPIGMAQDLRAIYPNDAGVWSIPLVQDAYACVRIPAQDVVKAFRVPVLAAANLKDIRALDGGGFLGSAMGAASPFRTAGT